MTHTVFSKILPHDDLAAFAAKEPMLLGYVAGYAFYEHPTKGDEAPLYAVGPQEREWGCTHFWDVPSVDELVEFEVAQ